MRDFDIDFDADSTQPGAGGPADSGIAGVRIVDKPGRAASFVEDDDEWEPTIVRGRE